MMWHYEFHEDGGYDCLSSAFCIYDDEALVATIDVSGFVGSDGTWESDHRRDPTAEAYAQRIVDRMNAPR